MDESTICSRVFDAIVIGSGATGSTAVKELTERGLEVLLLEAGRNISEADFVPQRPRPPKAMGIDLGGRLKATLKGQHVQARRAIFKAQTSKFLVNDRQVPYVADGDSFLWIRGRQLGGRLHAYGRVLLRSSDYVFKASSIDGLGDDWPISLEDLAPFYDDVERFHGVYGSHEGIPNLPDGVYRGPSYLNQAEQAFKNTVKNHWPERHVLPWRYAAPNSHRTPLGIVAGNATGRLTVRTDAVVSRITVDDTTKRADGAIFIDRNTKQEFRVHADVVVLCASTIESVRLLLNSRSSAHPDGLGNSSGLLGCYFMDQTPSLLFGTDPNHVGSEETDVAPPDPYYPPIGGLYMPRFDNLTSRGDTAFARGWAVQGTIGRMPVPDGQPGVVGLMAFGEMLANRDNRITTHSHRKDAWGIPIPVVHLEISDNERAMMRAQVRGLREMSEASGYQINFVGSALGLDSKKIWPDADPFSRAVFRAGFKKSLSMGAAIHECGGARMGSDPTTSVLNKFNQSWDVPNLFVTDSSCYVTNGGVGPTLTIMALTARACQYIAEGGHRRSNI